MSFNDVMYGSLGQVNQGFQNNLGLNAANMANSNALVNSWQNVPQVSQQQLYGGGSFGAQPAYYAALGAAYGRQVAPSSPAAVAAAHPSASVWNTGAPAYNAYGGGADQAWYLGGSQGPRPSEAYNAPRQYGWDHNEGAPAPAAPQVYNRGEFNPQTYGWDHNEGAPAFGGAEDTQWYLGGSQGPRPSSQGPSPSSQASAYSGDNTFGGARDIQWYLGGSQGPRPSSQSGGYIGNPKASAFSYNPAPMGDGGFGGAADIQWYLGGSQGPRPSSLSGASSANPYANTTKSQDWQSTFNNMVNGSGGNPYALGGAPWYPQSGGGGGIGSDYRFGGQKDIEWYLGGSQGARPSSRDDLAAAMSGAQDRLRAGQGWTIAQQPPAASQGTLTSRINQGIYDIGNAGDAYGRAFGMNLGNPQGLTPQDLVIPHAYPPEVKKPGPQSNLNWYGQPNASS